MAVRKAGAKGASNPYEPRLPGDTRAVIMMAFSPRAFVHDDEAAAPHDPVARRFRCITDQHSTAGRAPSRVGITRTVPPGRSVAENPCNPAPDPRGLGRFPTTGGLHGFPHDHR